MAIFQTRLIWPKSYYKNVLALNLFVGYIFAYFQMHMFSLWKSPTYIRHLVNILTTANERAHKNHKFLHFYHCHQSGCTCVWEYVFVQPCGRGGSHSFADGLKGPHVF